MVLKHIVSVDGAVSDHALAIQLVVSSKVISLQISETLSAFSILDAKGQSNNNLTPIIVIHSAQQLHICPHMSNTPELSRIVWDTQRSDSQEVRSQET